MAADYGGMSFRSYFMYDILKKHLRQNRWGENVVFALYWDITYSIISNMSYHWVCVPTICLSAYLKPLYNIQICESWLIHVTKLGIVWKILALLIGLFAVIMCCGSFSENWCLLSRIMFEFTCDTSLALTHYCSLKSLNFQIFWGSTFNWGSQGIIFCFISTSLNLNCARICAIKTY